MRTRTCQRCGHSASVEGWPRYARNGRLTLFCAACDADNIKARPFGREGRETDKHCTSCGTLRSRDELLNGYCRETCWPEYKRNRRLRVNWEGNRRARMNATDDGTVDDATLIKMRRTATECAYCGRTLDGDCQTDHIMPLCLGGAHSRRNIVVACRFCNQHKARMSPERWLDVIAEQHKPRVMALYVDRMIFVVNNLRVPSGTISAAVA